MPDALQPKILHCDPQAEYYTDERCFINELSNIPADDAVSIAQARVLVDEVTRWHKLLGITERYVILAGQGRVEVGQLPPCDVGPGAVVLIPPDCPQRIRNTGAADLVFLAICSPRFRPQCYVDLDPD
jgi:mannose-6-phosphate isomerase-like protein (cupin superfamily)